MTQYKIELKKFSQLKGLIEIPIFQRGLVWNTTKKKEFIKTLKAGLPIGILLLAPKNDKYLIIDGLQRFTTMADYASDYFKYIEEDEISDMDLVGIIMASQDAREIYDGYILSAKDQMRSDMREIIVSSYKTDNQRNLNRRATSIANEFIKRIAAFKQEDFQGIMQEIYDVLDKIEDNAKIDDIEIPVIIFTGKNELLADIFQKLNQEGVKLTKYDVFAATWINYTVMVKDRDFINLIIAKYDSAEDSSGLEISDYDADEMRSTGELTVFEYAFGVGKALMNKCTKLFKSVDESKVDSIGFLILAELLGLTYQEMGKLAKTIGEYDKVDYKKLKDSIVEAAQIVENALGSYIVSPTGRTRKTSLACHSELQLASYIIVVFKLKYELTKENGLVQHRGKYAELREVKKYLYKHYLYDILRDYWSGAGDSKLEDIIRDPFTCRYSRDVDKNLFEQVILSWLEASIEKTVQNTVSAQNKLFWNYYLRKKGFNVDQAKYDIEHCVPQKVLKNFFIKNGIEVPISSACNLCYIDFSDNRGKGERTYYQKQVAYTGAFTLNDQQLDDLLYPSREELQFTDSTDTLTKEAYFDFLKNRKSIIVKRMIEVLYE